jgi:hypothetical protein
MDEADGTVEGHEGVNKEAEEKQEAEDYER